MPAVAPPRARAESQTAPTTQPQGTTIGYNTYTQAQLDAMKAAVPQLEQLIQSGNYEGAFSLAAQFDPKGMQTRGQRAGYDWNNPLMSLLVNPKGYEALGGQNLTPDQMKAYYAAANQFAPGQGSIPTSGSELMYKGLGDIASSWNNQAQGGIPSVEGYSLVAPHSNFLKSFLGIPTDNALQMFDAVLKNPQRTIFGGTPWGTKIENKLTGSHFDPFMTQLGGPTNAEVSNSINKGGYELSAFKPFNTAANIIAGYEAGGALGDLGAAAGEAVGLGETGASIAGSVVEGVGTAAESGPGANLGLGAAKGLVSGGIGAGLDATGVSDAVSSAAGGGGVGDFASNAVTGAAGSYVGKTVGSAITSGGGNTMASQTVSGTPNLPGSNPTNWMTQLAAGSGIAGAAPMPAGAGATDPAAGAGATDPAAGGGTGSPEPPGTSPTAPPSTSTIGSDILSFLQSNGGTLSETALALYEASQQKKQNDAYANKLMTMGQPFVDASTQQLKDAQSGTLNPQQQALQTAQLGQGNTLVGQAGPLLDIANTAFTQYQQGILPAWQQAELDQQKASEMAQLKQSLGSQVDSSSLASAASNIDQKYEILKGNLMQQNLATGQNAFTQGVNTENLGFQDIQQGWQTGVQAIQDSFSNAISLLGAGGSLIQSGIGLAIQGDSQVTSALMEMFGLIGLGYAQQNAGAKSGGTSTGNKLLSDLQKMISGGVKAATSGGNSSSGGVPSTSGGTTPTDAIYDPNGNVIDPSTGQPFDFNVQDPNLLPVDTGSIDLSSLDLSSSTDLGSLFGGP